MYKTWTSTRQETDSINIFFYDKFKPNAKMVVNVLYKIKPNKEVNMSKERNKNDCKQFQTLSVNEYPIEIICCACDGSEIIC